MIILISISKVNLSSPFQIADNDRECIKIVEALDKQGNSIKKIDDNLDDLIAAHINQDFRAIYWWDSYWYTSRAK